LRVPDIAGVRSVVERRDNRYETEIMTRPLYIRLAAVLIIGSASVLVRADAEEEIRKELQANYTKVVKAFKKNDPAVWEGFLVTDFKLKLFNGTVQNRQWVVRYIRNNAKAYKVLKLTMVIKELKIKGVDATAVVEQKSSRTFHDEKDTAHRLDVGALQLETWTKTPSGWKLKSVEERKVLYLLKDGKP
jgi:hypothetical protein